MKTGNASGFLDNECGSKTRVTTKKKQTQRKLVFLVALLLVRVSFTSRIKKWKKKENQKLSGNSLQGGVLPRRPLTFFRAGALAHFPGCIRPLRSSLFFFLPSLRPVWFGFSLLCKEH